MKKVLISAPLYSASGYGEMARFALSVLRQHEDKYDIYVNVLNWGQTGWISEDNEEFNYIKELRIKTEHFNLDQTRNKAFDISLQITIPNEWKRLAKYNIGYTAGIETTSISPAWIDPCEAVDKIITISNFSRSVFVNTKFQGPKGDIKVIETPIDVVYFPYKESVEVEDLNLDLTTDFNFLSVNQWGPRKNVEQLLIAFLEEFKNDNVGLIFKTNMSSDNRMDRDKVENILKALTSPFPERKCKIYFLHGRLSEKQKNGLYRHPSVKAFVTATHGEGFGLPIFEATQAQLPVIATDWSGHVEFLSTEDKKLFAKVDYELNAIKPEFVWKGVMEENTGWAYPNHNSLKSKMREVYKDYGRFKSWAKKLSEHNSTLFNKEKIYSDFMNSFEGNENNDGTIIL